jgi:hypothetical protein
MTMMMYVFVRRRTIVWSQSGPKIAYIIICNYLLTRLCVHAFYVCLLFTISRYDDDINLLNLLYADVGEKKQH